MQVIGQKNQQYLVILAVDENAAMQEEEPRCVILDTTDNTVSPSLPVDRLLGQDGWITGHLITPIHGGRGG